MSASSKRTVSPSRLSGSSSKRQRGQEPEVSRQPEEEPEDVIFVVNEWEEMEPMVPCERCGASVAFSESALAAHMSICQAAVEVPSEDITCDQCGEIVAFSNFSEHCKKHSASDAGEEVACEVCGVLIRMKDLEDHLAAHRFHDQWLDNDMKISNSPADITAQLVEMARSGGAGLPGNRRQVAVGDDVWVRWSDGNWYGGRVRDVAEQISVAWDPPYKHWAPERVKLEAVMPRMTQPREVCNFDVALQFVKRLCSMKERSSKATQLEVVYHWTGEENVQKIIENNLKPPGSTNADGTAVQRLNGEAYGKGIYAATDLMYGKGFGRGLSCAFLCLAIPGHMGHGGHSMRLSGKDDCFKHGCLRVYKNSEQVLPLFFTDMPSSAKLAECAWDIADLLKERALGKVKEDPEFKKGDEVEALWHGSYWKAEVARVHRNGSYDIKWKAPYHHWPPEIGAAADRLRKCES